MPRSRKKKKKRLILGGFIPALVNTYSNDPAGLEKFANECPTVNKYLQSRKPISSSQQASQHPTVSTSNQTCSTSVFPSTSTRPAASSIRIKRLQSSSQSFEKPKKFLRIPRVGKSNTITANSCLPENTEKINKKTVSNCKLANTSSIVTENKNTSSFVTETVTPQYYNDENEDFTVSESNCADEEQRVKHHVKIKLDQTMVYEAEIRKLNAIMPVDAAFTKVILPDFNDEKSCLKFTSIVLVQRRYVITEQENIVSLYGCSCDPFEQALIETLDTVTSYNQSEVNNCIHISVAKKLIDELFKPDEDFDPFSYVQDEELNELTEVSFDATKFLIITDRKIGVVGQEYGKFKCLLCSQPFCCHIKYVNRQKNKEDDTPSILADFSHVVSKPDFKAVSSIKIEVTANQRSQFCLKTPVQVYLLDDDNEMTCIDSHLTTCNECNEDMSLAPYLHEMKNLFTKENVFKCKVFQQICINPECLSVHFYDGGNDGVLNMGKFLIHHGVLRDYMLHFLNGNSCTLSGYYEIWKLTQQTAGNVSFHTLLNSSNWRQSWYSFLNLLDIDHQKAAICQKCGTVPDIIVCDATSLGYQKKFAAIGLIKEGNSKVVYPRYSDHSSRIAITSKPLREKFRRWVDKKLTIISSKEFLLELRSFNRAIFSAVKWTFDAYTGSTIPKGIQDLFRCVASASPVCSYVYPSDSVHSTIQSLCDPGTKSDAKLLKSLQREAPIFFNILTELMGSCFPEEFKGLLLYLCDKSMVPFAGACAVSTSNRVSSTSLCSFPNLPELRLRGRFAIDKDGVKADSCRKFYRGHPRLMPGIFTIYCSHGICYGYQVMESQESPNVPFTIFRTRFPVAPKLVIYDYACGLHAYCLNRDPLYFQKTLFMVDRFHWKNHTGCSLGYDIKKYLHLKDVNTEINEQQNAATKRLKNQLSYMNTQHFLMHCNFFFWYQNIKKKKKMDK